MKNKYTGRFHARSKARRLAMQAAYQWQATGQDIDEIIQQFKEGSSYRWVDPIYFKQLLQASTSESLDAKLEECMARSMAQIDTIERFILRNAAYEIVYVTDVNPVVAINEAVKIAKKFCGSGSFRFVNAVLDCFAKKYAHKHSSEEGNLRVVAAPKAALSEAQLIAQYFAQPQSHGDRDANIEIGIGDDAAVIRVPFEHLATTTDTLVEGVHFKHGCDAGDLGHKALAVNLSDLAAMGAQPHWALLALTLPQVDRGWLEAFSDGFFALAKRHRVSLIGGDTTQGARTITVHLIGSITKAHSMRRDRALVGEGVYVSGRVGDTALAALHSDTLKLYPQSHRECIARLQRPPVRVAEGLCLAPYASAAVDISDGVLKDLTRLLEASRVGAEIELSEIPMIAEIEQCCPSVAARLQALCYGEDYELLFTLRDKYVDKIKLAFDNLGTALTRIGTISESRGLRCYWHSEAIELPESIGYEHFAE